MRQTAQALEVLRWLKRVSLTLAFTSVALAAAVVVLSLTRDLKKRERQIELIARGTREAERDEESGSKSG
jgi:hypothetical protein